MEVFDHLILKLIPLYFCVVAGYIAGRVLRTERDMLAGLVFYIFSPLVFFNGVVNTQLSLVILATPILSFTLASSICLATYAIAGRYWQDSTRNILAYTSGCGNTGYFGIPVALLLFDKQTEGIYILIVLGLTLYENSLGFFIAARGRYSVEQSLQKLVRIPTTYAFLLGLLVNYSGVGLWEPVQDFLSLSKQSYSMLGMMIVGLGLASLRHLELDWRFIGSTLFLRFILWPSVMRCIVFLDSSYFGLFDHNTHKALLLASIVPLAANTVIFASLLRTQPEKSATAVLISTVVAMIYVPYMASSWLMP